MLDLILLIAAFILFVLAGVGVSGGKFNLVAIGLACATLAFLIPRV